MQRRQMMAEPVLLCKQHWTTLEADLQASSTRQEAHNLLIHPQPLPGSSGAAELLPVMHGVNDSLCGGYMSSMD